MFGANSIENTFTFAAPSQVVEPDGLKPVKPRPVRIDAPCMVKISMERKQRGPTQVIATPPHLGQRPNRVILRTLKEPAYLVDRDTGNEVDNERAGMA